MLVVLGELSINPTMTQGTLDGLRFGDGWSFASFSQKPKWSVSFPARKTSMDGRSAKETIGPNGLLMALSFVTYCGAIYRYRPGLMPVTDLKSRVKCD